jgi:predicted DNA-binding transcriptional regulator AlpA
MSQRLPSKLQDGLAYPPYAMKAERAAAYLDMSRSKFLELVEQGRLPQPKFIGGIVVWDRLALEAAFNEFPARSDSDSVEGRRNTFDEILRD